MLSYSTMQNTPPAELTRLIEPIEVFLVERLARSIELQSTLIKEIQLCVQSGQSACQLDALQRLDRLQELQRLKLKLYQDISSVGHKLFELQRYDPECLDEPEEVPF